MKTNDPIKNTVIELAEAHLKESQLSITYKNIIDVLKKNFNISISEDYVINYCSNKLLKIEDYEIESNKFKYYHKYQ